MAKRIRAGILSLTEQFHERYTQKHDTAMLSKYPT